MGNKMHDWKNAFEGAEVAPSDSVWTNIELELEKDAGGKMKQRLLFYKWLAAASVVFAMGIAGTYYLSVTNEDAPAKFQATNEQVNEGISEIETEESTTESSNQESGLTRNEVATTPGIEKSVNKQTGKSGSDNAQKSFVTRKDTDKQKVKVETTQPVATAQPIASVVKPAPNENFASRFSSPLNSQLVDKKQPVLVIPKEMEPESIADPGMVLLAKLRDEEKKYAEKEKKNSDEKVWTSLGFAAGSYNPNSSGSTVLNSGINGPGTASVSNPSSGSSYAVGIQVGGKITDRLVLLGGISYLTQNASYTSNTVFMEANTAKASLNDYAFSGKSQSMATPQYNLNNNLQFVSLPVQAGYVVLDRKFAIQLNGGIATDFFLLNTLTPDDSSIDKTTQGPGDDSQYRSVNFSGLLGTEFSYRLADRYRLALNPGMRYALNSIYKAEVPTEVSPITYDVALKFRYIFK